MIKLKKTLKYIASYIPKDILYFFIYGREYFKIKNQLKKNLFFDEVKELKKLLIHAYETTTYYKKKFDEIEFNPYSFNKIEDIKKVKTIDKNEIIKNLEDFKSKKYKKNKFQIVTTGGTSGVQMKFYHQKKKSIARELAFIHFIWSSVGYSYKNSWRAIFRNQVLDEKLYVIDRYNKSIIFNTYIMTDKKIKKMIEVLNKYKPEFIHGYPSAVLILAEAIKLNKYELEYKFKSILLSSENLYEGQREFIEKIFNCKIFTFYGHSELSGMAINGKNDNNFHILKEYGYIELIDKNGEVISENDKIGEIVVTGYGTAIMPFIRYRTADYSSYLNYEKRILKDIKGRWTQEMLITELGNKISITAINMHSDIFKNVKNYQFIQNEIGKVELKIIRNPKFNSFDELQIRKEISKKLGRNLKLEINLVDKIEKTLIGKQRFLIQNIK